MYHQFFGLRQSPFDITESANVFPTKTHSPPLLQYWLRSQSGIAAVTGRIGAGKSSLCYSLLNDATDYRKISTHCTDSALADIAAELETLPTVRAIAAKLGSSAVLLYLDEAQRLTADDLQHLQHLTALCTKTRLMISGTPELIETLSTAPAVFHRITCDLRLEPLTLAELAGYIDHRLKAAGRATGALFDDDATAVIYKATQGNPRLINHVADAALLFAFSEGAKTVTADIAGDAIVEKQNLLKQDN